MTVSLLALAGLGKYPLDFLELVTVGPTCDQTGASMGDQRAVFITILHPGAASQQDLGLCP